MITKDEIIKSNKEHADEIIYEQQKEIDRLNYTIKEALDMIERLQTSGWVEEQNGTTFGYAPAKKCCKYRLKIIEAILRSEIDVKKGR